MTEEEINDYYRSEEKMEYSYKCCMFALIGMIVGVVLAILTSCTTTRYVPVIQKQKENVYVNKKDSSGDNYIQNQSEKESRTSNIYTEKRDSSVTTVDQQGNVINQEHWHWSNTSSKEYIEKEKILKDSIDRLRVINDSLSALKSDSIPVPYPVEKKLTRWQQTKIDWGGEAIVILGIISFTICWLTLKRRLKR